MNTTPPFPPELWEQTPIAVRESIRTIEARVAALEATVQQLLERWHQDSHNSSRPPSSDLPQAMQHRPRHGPSGRKRGGQLGHQGQSRALIPIAEVETVIPVKPR
jgi:transposase